MIRMREGQRATTAEGRSGSLGRLLLGPGGKRQATVTLDAMAEKGVPGPAIAVRAVRPKGRKPVIVATNRPELRALEAYRKRWAIESFFADAKTRGFNFEDTRLTDPRKLSLLTAILAIAIAWANATADRLLGRCSPPRKNHGYLARISHRDLRRGHGGRGSCRHARTAWVIGHGCALRLGAIEVGFVVGVSGWCGAGVGQPHNRAWARRKTAASGQLEAMAMRMRRTLRVTRAPIFRSFRRMLPQVAVARSVPARPMRRSAVTST